MYHELLTFLLFVSTPTRRDIAAAVSILCRSASNPKTAQWVGLKRVLKYLQGTKDFSILISASSEQQLSDSCDSEWSRDREDCRSTAGVLLQLDYTTAAWRSIKQTTVALIYRGVVCCPARGRKADRLDTLFAQGNGFRTGRANYNSREQPRIDSRGR